MRWLIMLFVGMALGAGALFSYLRWYGDEAPGAVEGVAPVAAMPAAAPPPPLPAATVSAGTAAAPFDGEAGAAALTPADGMQAADGSSAPTGTLGPAAGSVVAPARLDPNALPPNADPHPPSGKTSSATPSVRLLLPVEGVKLAHLSDTFTQPRGKERLHEALDIMAPKGAKVLAVADGKVTKLFESKLGGLTVYQFDPDEKFSYYYAHLDRYADNLKEGQAIKRGDVLGYVGVTGNSDPNAPHLHFAVFELPATKEWWKGKPVNPFPLIEQTGAATVEKKSASQPDPKALKKT